MCMIEYMTRRRRMFGTIDRKCTQGDGRWMPGFGIEIR